MRGCEPWRRPSGLVLGNQKFGERGPHIIIQSSRLRPGEFETHAACARFESSVYLFADH